MSVQIAIEIIDRGKIINRGVITDDNWDGALFDHQEAKKRLDPGQWIHIPDYWEIPDPHRIAFA